MMPDARTPAFRLLFLLLTGALGTGAVGTGCSSPPPPPPRVETAPRVQSAAPALPAADGAEIELVESAPIETSLDHPDVRNASEVWTELLDRAKRTVDLAEFYASEADGDRAKTSRLAPVIAALERATKRGVRVRFLADASFAPKYPASLEQLRRAGATVKTIDCSKRYGGVQHAKYMIIDDDEAFVGSQNFDWRALEHIQEMGVRLRSPAIAGALHDLFETDWTLADPGAPNEGRVRAHPSSFEARARTGEAVSLTMSPKGWLPDESRWDLPRIVGLLDGARSSVTLQVLTYSTKSRDHGAFTTLDEALRRAASRGVRVRLLVSHWGANPGSQARRSIEALASLPNVEVRVLTIPPWSGGEIPFARVSHAKYLVVDDRAAWVGTSNWEGDYFLKTRNVAIIAEGGALAPRLARIFQDGWSSPYAAPLAAAPASHATEHRSSEAGRTASRTW